MSREILAFIEAPRAHTLTPRWTAIEVDMQVEKNEIAMNIWIMP